MEYIERQKFNQWWLWLLLFGVFLSTLVPIFQEGLNDGFHFGMLIGPAVTALIMIFIATLEMRTTISEDGIEVKFWPIVTKRIFRSEIEGAVVRKYSPLREFGGWGYRFGINGPAINMQGNQGLQLALKDGKSFMIGTQKPAELAAFMENYLEERNLELEALKLKEIEENKLER